MNVFDFKDYKAYVNQRLDVGARGARSRLAREIDCQPGYVSRVLSGDTHFSLEQADAVNRFFGHTEDESVFFILLVEWARAGTPSLRHHFQKQIEEAHQRYLNLKNRLQIRTNISEKEQSAYFSSWHYSAIHASLSVPALNDKDALAQHLRLPIKRVSEVLDQLTQMGLIQLKNGKYESGTTRLHLGNDSPLIAKHHINWRLQAIQALERDRGEDLHYSSVVSLSQADVIVLKGKLIKAIEEFKSVIRESKEETVASFSLDFFKL